MACLRINLWSGPRNVSTAIMYSFAQRSDTRVIDEPLYGHYLQVTGAKHPGDQEVMDAMDCDGERVVREIILGECHHPVLFIKNMAHHLVEIGHGFLEQTCNVFLIRDPKQMLPSLINQIPQPNLRDTAYKTQYDLMQELQGLGQSPPVLDARKLLLNPEKVLRELCQRIELSFDKEMMNWPVGQRPEDGVWAPYWYHSVHKSTEFQKYKPKTDPFPEFLRPLLDECKPYYETLLREAITANSK